jgi:hypothetical protein
MIKGQKGSKGSFRCSPYVLVKKLRLESASRLRNNLRRKMVKDEKSKRLPTLF